MKRLPLHPLCAAFPMMPEEEVHDMELDVRVNGLLTPITTFKGQIIDGQNRQEICHRLGIEPKYVEFTGDDLVAFVISMNMRRRNLSESQRAMIAANLANIPHGGDRKSDQSVNSPIEQVSQKKAAELMQVGVKSVGDAKAVLESGDKKLIEDVKSNAKSVSKAAKEIRASKPKIVASNEKLKVDDRYEIIHFNLHVFVNQPSAVQRRILAKLANSIGKHCYVFFECNNEMLTYSFELIQTLKLKYRCNMIIQGPDPFRSEFVKMRHTNVIVAETGRLSPHDNDAWESILPQTPRLKTVISNVFPRHRKASVFPAHFKSEGAGWAVLHEITERKNAAA